MKITTVIALLMTAQDAVGPEAEVSAEVSWDDGGTQAYVFGPITGVSMPDGKSVILTAEREV